MKKLWRNFSFGAVRCIKKINYRDMELVSLAKEVLQNIAEHAASYRAGQTVVRYLDRSLWVVEKCARWAVPPPMDQDERPQPELVRPLPWVFFLITLVALRITRESISLFNLVLGKPPLRSADVVMYIQSKRRYLRTLKYQGTRVMRARSEQPRDTWRGSLASLLDFTLCFRRQQHNNNTTSAANNEEILVVKRSKRGRQHSSPVVSTESTMERLIEKMMVDLDAESDEDSSFTLTNVTSAKSDNSDFTVESDQDTTYINNVNKSLEINSPEQNEAPRSTPEPPPERTPERTAESSPEIAKENVPPFEMSPKEISKAFLQQEMTSSKIPRTPNNEKKIANGRTSHSVPSKRKGSKVERDRRTNSETYVGKHGSAKNISL